MPNYTSKYNLAMPTNSELYDIEVFNNNFNKIANALSALEINLGSSPISNVTDDTFEKWSALGTGYAFYGTMNQLNGQPSTYGYLINIASTSNVAQLWMTLPHGTMYYRGGNTSGLATSWTKVINSENVSEVTLNTLNGILSVEKGGTGKTNTAEAYKELSKRGSITNNNLTDANRLTSPGVHQVYIEDMTISATDYNFPYRYGVLIVDGYAAYASQTFYSLSEFKMYYRTSHNSGSDWSDWYTTYGTANKPTMDDIGIRYAASESAMNALTGMKTGDLCVIPAEG